MTRTPSQAAVICLPAIARHGHRHRLLDSATVLDIRGRGHPDAAHQDVPEGKKGR